MTIEHCPVCQCPHEKGKYISKFFMCHCCHVLKWVLPIFKRSESGYMLQIVGPKEFNQNQEAL